MVFQISNSPYTHHSSTISNTMLLVILATLPGISAQWYFFGIGSLIQILLAIITAWITEGLILWLRNLTILKTLSDNSATLTALLLGLSLPPLSPWWLVVLGTIFAIVIGKQLYGGLGQNLFNPAMVGYAVLLISFPLQMTHWTSPTALQETKFEFMDVVNIIFTGHASVDGAILQLQHLGVDGISQATPLNILKNRHRIGANHQQLYWPISTYKNILTHLAWQWVNIGYLIGGSMLLIKNVIRWHIPISFLISLSMFTVLGWLFSPETLNVPIVHLFYGSTMLGAFFIATDPVTAATTNVGRLIYGGLIGMFTWLIRSFGDYPDGLAFSVLLANMFVTSIDYYTQPRIYGSCKENQ
ncbi:RnfD protein [Candidatus Pantoea carbekii]|uniref:Ion-translocating oxidoreductase complex subunit D n=1 Tax=Candidatus Pantoea carbekii TaxID=1235990 RepID=U3U6M3_9GAMM|nr:RnfD protein [Candidatus Pantoea carbekii]